MTIGFIFFTRNNKNNEKFKNNQEENRENE